MLDSNSQRHKYAMVQYHFDGPEVEIKVKPHGNSKSAAPFFVLQIQPERESLLLHPHTTQSKLFILLHWSKVGN